MFVLTRDHAYDWPVDVKVPVDGGRFETRAFTARFRIPAKARMDELFRTSGSATAKAFPNDFDLAREVLVGWKDVEDETGGPLAFDDQNRDALLSVPYVLSAIIEAYLGSLYGQAARRKN